MNAARLSSILALFGLVSGASALLYALSLHPGDDSPDGGPSYVMVLEDHVTQLERALAEAEHDTVVLAEELRMGLLARSEEPLPEHRTGAPSVGERLLALQNRMSRLEEALARDAFSKNAKEGRERAEAQAQALAAYTLEALNVMLPVERRVSALEVLRRYARARSPEVVESMHHLLLTERDDIVRARIARSLGSIDDPELIATWIRILDQDPSAIVREEAAENLRKVSRTPEVDEALSRAAAYDPSAIVREEATRSLNSR